ncbi:hypothetical protein WDJ51_01980 [Rathayibacter sp. YIM 133350]|uniref:hypothetical protein n=1 Tax=Rathayibacter sp. YIM 133350 TaxID=3131992 RepID=UPI00307FAD24
MRWDELFDDLEGQLEQELRADESDHRVEEERLRLGRLLLRDRIMVLSRTPSTGAVPAVRFELLGGATLTVRPTAFGRDWLAGDVLDGSPWHPQCVLPLAAVASVVLDRSQVDPSLEAAPSDARLRIIDRMGLPFVLRDLCRRRSAVEVMTAGGAVHGTIDRVGRDHLDLAVHEAGVPRRDRAVRQYRLVPLEQVRLVRLAG